MTNDNATTYLLLPAATDNNSSSTHRGSVVLFHGWAQNKSVMSFKTKNMTKRLRQAGYDCYLVDGPIHLPLKRKEKKKTNDDDDDYDDLHHEQTFRRENARAWFLQPQEETSEVSMLPQTQRTNNYDEEVVGNNRLFIGWEQTTLPYLECVLQDIFRSATSKQRDQRHCQEESSCSSEKAAAAASTKLIVAAIGFSHGAACVHLLARLAAAGQNHAATTPFDKFVFVGGFLPTTTLPPNQQEELPQKNKNNHVASQLKEGGAILDVPSLHLIGANDTSVWPSQSRELAAEFVNPIVWTHDKGHVFPTHKAACQVVLDFLK